MGNATGNATGDRGNSEMIELTKWLGIKLRPGEILTLLVCQQLIGQDIYLADIAAATGQSEPTTRRAMQKLQRLGHLAYSVFNRGCDDPNYKVLWARTAIGDVTPKLAQLRRDATLVVVEHPECGRKSLVHGQIRKFAKENGLNYRAFRSVLGGDRNHHHGWRLVRKASGL